MGRSASAEPIAPRHGPPEPDPVVSTSVAKLIQRWALALFVVQRVASVAVATTPWVSPDEYGAWAIAAALVTGDAPMTMRDTPTYPLASGVVLAPIEALGLDPVLAYRLAVAWLGFLVLVAAWMVRSALRHLCPGRPVVPEAAFALVLLFPATTVTTAFTWAETAVLVWWAAFLMVLVRALVQRHDRWVLVASVLVGLAPVIHGRLSLVPLIWLAVAAVRGLRERDWWPWAPGAVITLVVAVLGAVWQRSLVARVWDRPDEGRGPVDDLAAPGEVLGWLVTASGGQLWYAIVASAGLAALGVTTLASWGRGRTDSGAAERTTPDPIARPGTRTLSVVLGASLLSNLALSASFMARSLATLSAEADRFGSNRWDHVVYGRYIDAAVVVLAVLGLVRLLARRTARPRPHRELAAAGVAAMALATMVGLSTRTADLGDRLELTVAGVTWLPLRTEGLALMQWTAVGMVLIGAITIAATRSRRTLLLTLAAWLVLGSCLATVTAVEHHTQRTRPDLTAELGAPAGDMDRLLLPSDVEELSLWRLGVFAQQRDLVHRGWQLEFVDRISAAAGRHAAADVGALVLLDDVTPDGTGWAPVAEFGGATVWRRSGG